MDWTSELHDPDELWRKMKECEASNDYDSYYLLARRVQELVDTCVDHYGLCQELGSAHGRRAYDATISRPGREVAAIRAYHYFGRAANLAATATDEVRVVPQGMETMGNGCMDRQGAQLRCLREAAQVLQTLDWITEPWRWQWITECLAPVVQASQTYEPAHLALGEAYLNLGDLDRAEATWRQAKRLPNAGPHLDSHLIAVRTKRAERAIQAGDWGAVVSVLDGQSDLTPAELVLLGDAFLEQGAPERARGCWEAAVRADPGVDGAQKRLGDQAA